jgi:hypothetical protein
MKFNILLILSFMIAYPIFAEDAEVLTVIGTRLPSGGGGGGGAAAAMSSGLPSSHSERCDDPNCGQDVKDDLGGGGVLSYFDMKEVKLTGLELLEWLKKTWKIKSAFGRSNFMCRADIVCQSENDIGLTCQAIGTYFTADEAYNRFSSDGCCEREGKGHQIGVNWQNCSLY